MWPILRLIALEFVQPTSRRRGTTSFLCLTLRLITGLTLASPLVFWIHSADPVRLGSLQLLASPGLQLLLPGCSCLLSWPPNFLSHCDLTLVSSQQCGRGLFFPFVLSTSLLPSRLSVSTTTHVPHRINFKIFPPFLVIPSAFLGPLYSFLIIRKTTSHIWYVYSCLPKWPSCQTHIRARRTYKTLWRSDKHEQVAVTRPLPPCPPASTAWRSSSPGEKTSPSKQAHQQRQPWTHRLPEPQV